MAENQKVYKGKIVALSGSWGSGLAELIINDNDRGLCSIHCENGPTVRALDACFGNVIGAGHTINNKALKGKSIYYSVDFIGVLDGFTPVKGAPASLVSLYKKGRLIDDGPGA